MAQWSVVFTFHNTQTGKINSYLSKYENTTSRVVNNIDFKQFQQIWDSANLLSQKQRLQQILTDKLDDVRESIQKFRLPDDDADIRKVYAQSRVLALQNGFLAGITKLQLNFDSISNLASQLKQINEQHIELLKDSY
ncbi:hypothetical protein [Paucilactobacillus nenjiangensis]|uniref:hypothetical protein n=1 Tax=Paucilactobacillus nenjiangensis TaxID=1296540 RepID=UPI003FA272E5